MCREILCVFPLASHKILTLVQAIGFVQISPSYLSTHPRVCVCVALCSFILSVACGTATVMTMVNNTIAIGIPSVTPSCTHPFSPSLPPGIRNLFSSSVMLFPECDTNEIMQYVSFWDWLFILGVIFLRFIQVVCICSSFLTAE